VTELIKRVGGFRIGTYPDFEAATRFSDPVGYLRRLCPYASAVCASTIRFKERKAPKGGAGPMLDPPLDHEPYDLGTLVHAVASVGYDGALSIDYRGTGDVPSGIRASRNAILKCLSEDDDDLDEDLDDDFTDAVEDVDEALGSPGDEE
jgi:hypothetical protein